MKCDFPEVYNSCCIFWNWNVKKIPHKTGGVVVPNGFGIAKSLQDRVRLDDLILQGALWEDVFTINIYSSVIIHMCWVWARSIVLHKRTSITFACLGLWSRLPSSGTHTGEVLDDLFGVLSLASSRFSAVSSKLLFFFKGIRGVKVFFHSLCAYEKTTSWK